MTLDFTCQKCEGTFEIDAQDLIDGSEKLECPHCNTRAPANVVDDFVAALTEMRAQVSALSKRFTLSTTLESEDLAELDADDDEDDDDDDDEDEDEDVDDDDEDDEDDDDDDEDLDEDDEDLEDEDEER
jgi:DNA-directed RNA polymerase subunit RPC12/RpoP